MKVDNIAELIFHLDKADAINGYQLISDILVSVNQRGKKGGDQWAELKILTDALTATEVANNTAPVGIVLWMDRDKYLDFVERIDRE